MAADSSGKNWGCVNIDGIIHAIASNNRCQFRRYGSIIMQMYPRIFSHDVMSQHEPETL